MAITLTITMGDDGQVAVNGPLGDKLICYGLLELAKESIEQWNRDHARRVQPVALLPGARAIGANSKLVG